MRVVTQRVKQAFVEIAQVRHSTIKHGMLILLGIEETDAQEDIIWLVNKLVNLRIFSDAEDKMNLSIREIKGEFLVISQFTLCASTKKGNRPSFIGAAKPQTAITLYDNFIATLTTISGLTVLSGIFGADMQVSLTNDGPVTIIIDSRHRE